MRISDEISVNLPNFLGIGAERSGTTWIYECLKEHPEVFVSDEKELHFFTTAYDRGVTWYAEQFRDRGNRKVIGEISPEYLYKPEAPVRIKETIPNVRMIVSLRNPIDRAYSQFGWEVLRKKHSYTFEEALKKSPDYVEKGFYDEQINRFYRLFPRDQILILFYEDLVRAPLVTIEKIYRFIGVDSTYIPKILHIKKNRGMTKSDSVLFKMLFPVSTLMRSKKLLKYDTLVRVVRKIRQQKLTEKVLESVFGRFGSVHVNEHVRDELSSIYNQHNLALSLLVGRDVNEIWN